jgi:predicted O-linked N-acetylglucosamine transferase (SPINDLY family)
MGMFSIAHHTLDTIDWNGGNSSFQSFSLGCPVVTLPTRFMRGRHTVAMLRQMEIEDLIATDANDYVTISTRLLNDGDFYASVRQQIAERQEHLFCDDAVAIAFKNWVDQLSGHKCH